MHFCHVREYFNIYFAVHKYKQQTVHFFERHGNKTSPTAVNQNDCISVGVWYQDGKFDLMFADYYLG